MHIKESGIQYSVSNLPDKVMRKKVFSKSVIASVMFCSYVIHVVCEKGSVGCVFAIYIFSTVYKKKMKHDC